MILPAKARLNAVNDARSGSARLIGDGPQYALDKELWLNLGDGVNQAANLISGATSIPSLNFTPLMTFGN